MEPIEESALNPDASEFKPSWLKAATPASTEKPSVTLTPSSQFEAEEKSF
jgi:hypothetical protein